MNSTGQQTRRNSDSTPAGRFQPANNKPGAPKDTGKATVPPGRTWLWFLGILLANYLLMRFFVPSPDAPVTVPYTLFKEEVGKGNVEGVLAALDMKMDKPATLGEQRVARVAEGRFS